MSDRFTFDAGFDAIVDPSLIMLGPVQPQVDHGFCTPETANPINSNCYLTDYPEPMPYFTDAFSNLDADLFAFDAMTNDINISTDTEDPLLQGLMQKCENESRFPEDREIRMIAELAGIETEIARGWFQARLLQYSPLPTSLSADTVSSPCPAAIPPQPLQMTSVKSSGKRRLDESVRRDVMECARSRFARSCASFHSRKARTDLKFQCTRGCGFSTQSRDSWQRHEQKWQPQGLWHCVLCRKLKRKKPSIFRRKDKILAHFQTFHGVTELKDRKKLRDDSYVDVPVGHEEKCKYVRKSDQEECGYRFQSWQDRIEHYRQHFDDRLSDGPWELKFGRHKWFDDDEEDDSDSSSGSIGSTQPGLINTTAKASGSSQSSETSKPRHSGGATDSSESSDLSEFSDSEDSEDSDAAEYSVYSPAIGLESEREQTADRKEYSHGIVLCQDLSMFEFGMLAERATSETKVNKLPLLHIPKPDEPATKLNTSSRLDLRYSPEPFQTPPARPLPANLTWLTDPRVTNAQPRDPPTQLSSSSRPRPKPALVQCERPLCLSKERFIFPKDLQRHQLRKHESYHSCAACSELTDRLRDRRWLQILPHLSEDDIQSPSEDLGQHVPGQQQRKHGDSQQSENLGRGDPSQYHHSLTAQLNCSPWVSWLRYSLDNFKGHIARKHQPRTSPFDVWSLGVRLVDLVVWLRHDDNRTQTSDLPTPDAPGTRGRFRDPSPRDPGPENDSHLAQRQRRMGDLVALLLFWWFLMGLGIGRKLFGAGGK